MGMCIGKITKNNNKYNKNHDNDDNSSINDENNEISLSNEKDQQFLLDDLPSFNQKYTASYIVLGKGADAIVCEGIINENAKQWSGISNSINKVAIKIISLDQPKFISKPSKFVDLNLKGNSIEESKQHGRDGFFGGVDYYRNEKKKELLLKRIKNEIELLRSMNHKGIIKLLDTFENVNKFVMVLEYAHGGSLFDRIMKIKKFPEEDALIVFYNIVKAVQYIHNCNIVHRDLKPENILFKTPFCNDQILICDFGYADRCDGDNLKELLGTPNYVAPEILLQHPYGKSVDIWALGVLLFIILSGNFPFNHSTQNNLFKLIVRSQFSFDVYKHKWNKVSQDAKTLIKKILVVNKEERYTIDDIINDPWMKPYRLESSM